MWARPCSASSRAAPRRLGSLVSRRAGSLRSWPMLRRCDNQRGQGGGGGTRAASGQSTQPWLMDKFLLWTPPIMSVCSFIFLLPLLPTPPHQLRKRIEHKNRLLSQLAAGSAGSVGGSGLSSRAAVSDLAGRWDGLVAQLQAHDSTLEAQRQSLRQQLAKQLVDLSAQASGFASRCVCMLTPVL